MLALSRLPRLWLLKENGWQKCGASEKKMCSVDQLPRRKQTNLDMIVSSWKIVDIRHDFNT